MDPEEEAQLEAAAGPSGIFAGRGGEEPPGFAARAAPKTLSVAIARQLSGAATASKTVDAMRAAAVAIPFIGLTYVWLGAGRGLKIMRHTLYVQWVAQPILWIAFMVAFWQVDKTEAMAVWA